MLRVVGLSCGYIMAREIKAKVDDLAEYETVVRQALGEPKKFFSKKIQGLLRYKAKICKLFYSYRAREGHCFGY